MGLAAAASLSGTGTMPRRARNAAVRTDRRPGDEFATYVADMLSPLGPVQVGRLFSGHGFKLDGVQFAMIIRGTLYLRADAALGGELAALGSQPFRYQTKQRTVTVGSYHAVPPDQLDDSDIVVAWARRALLAARANMKRAKSVQPEGGDARVGRRATRVTRKA